MILSGRVFPTFVTLSVVTQGHIRTKYIVPKSLSNLWHSNQQPNT
jgi:hypothetical protein